ncbi:MAG TPA: primosomal protein N' [Actinomycetes bacterium]|nr:primosomal protein N' [Actinomycetes bacterium]
MSGTDEGGGGEQLALLRSTARKARSSPPRPAPEPAAERSVARVLVDVPLPHLDRPFDYLVTAEQAAAARPGARVRVRFAGRLVDGFVLERADSTEHQGRLAALHKVMSPEPVLSPEIARLAREVADHYAGSVADVLRLAVPPRHARTEALEHALPVVRQPRPEPGQWERYPRGRALLDAVHSGGAPRAAWTALPGPAWPAEIALLVVTALSAGRGALVVVPDTRDVQRVADAVHALAPGVAAMLTADAGPAARYGRWLAIRRGATMAVIGTRAAMFAPVRDLGLAVVWDDGDDLHDEPRAPYPQVRTVLAMRSRLEGAALVVGGFTRTTEAAAMVRSGWAEDVSATRDTVRQVAPAVRGIDDEVDPRDPAGQAARLPTLAWRTAAQALEQGPVLVQVPRSGYLPGLGCATCRAPARCAACAGPLASPAAGATPACRWCGVAATGWACAVCGGTRLRATAVGSGRTAEELGRAFPRTTVRSSSAGGVLARVGPEPGLVVATPGAEPVAEGGYAAALLLDGWALLNRPDLRVTEEALRRWMGAAALVRPGPEGGRVVVLADSAGPAVQALVRWDPVTFADRELAERAALRLPPDTLLVSLTGEAAAVQALLAASDLPDGVDLLGPVPAAAGQERLLVRGPRTGGRAIVAALRAGAGVRSAHKDAGAVRIQVDPREIA